MSNTFLTSLKHNSKTKKINLHHKFSTSSNSNVDNKLFSSLHKELAKFTSESASTQLIRKRKELGEAESSLSKIRQESARKLESLDQRNTSFRRKKREIQQEMKRFETFVQENNQKRDRARLKVQFERKQISNLDEILKELRNKLRSIQIERKKLHHRLSGLSKYQEYLELVTEDSPETYGEINEILARHKTLRNMRQDLECKEEKEKEKVERARTMLRELNVEGQKLILIRQGQVHNYQKHVEGLAAERERATGEREREMKRNRERCTEFARVLMATRNLYARCVSTSSVGSVKWKEAEKAGEMVKTALKYISDRVRILEDVKNSYAGWVAESGKGCGGISE